MEYETVTDMSGKVHKVRVKDENRRLLEVKVSLPNTLIEVYADGSTRQFEILPNGQKIER